MSFDKEIGTPFTLASLPRSISCRDGRTHAASVCSISGTKKRKRAEIAVGLDGEGISIYSLHNPQLVTSYALPPQTSFASAPCSVYYKGSTKRPSRRYTYAFVSQNTPGAKPHLVCFSEETRQDTTTDTAKTSYTPSDAPQRIISIDVIPVPAGASQQRASHEVLAIFGNGHVICLSSDLDVVRWVANTSALAPSPKEAPEVDSASINPARALTRGLLKNREDIVAVLNPALDEDSDLLDLTQVMSVICRQTDGRRALALFQIRPWSPDFLSNRLPPLKHIATWEFPASNLESAPGSEPMHDQFILHASSGAVHHISDGGLLVYDFSGTVPKISSELSRSVLTVDSVLRISQDLLLTASRSSCQILNVKYTSLHAERTIEHNTQNPTKEARKRKHTASELGEPSSKAPALIAYYSDSGLAVGSWNNELVGFQLGGSTRRKRVKSQGARLIDSLGKGISSSMNDQQDAATWRDKTSKLDRYASKGEIAIFEEVFAAELGVKLQSVENEAEADAKLVNGHHDTVVTNGVDSAKSASGAQEESSELPRKWILSKILSRSMSAAKRSRHQQYAAYALSRIFRWVDSPSSHGPSGCLKIEFFPPNVFEWLMHSGKLTKESIRRAILDDPTSNLGITTPIRDGDIVRAVVKFDPELHILSAILNHGHFLPIGEVVQAVKLLMRSLDDQPRPEHTPKLLTNGNTNGTESHANVIDVDIVSELEAASHEIDHALAILDNGPTVISGSLRPALMRLHTFPLNVVSSTLRSMLTRHDLVLLIKLLHHELKNGGWTSPYDFGDSETPETNPLSDEIDDSAVAIIASLLSCTLDAIGPALWLTPVSDTSTDQLIQELREDVEEALTGFWEARYIRGILSELLRYGSQIPKSQKPSSKSLEKQGKPFALETKPDELPMLPLGSKPDLGVKKTKAGKGGQKKERSAREMGMLISKRVPKYSFERIAI